VRAVGRVFTRAAVKWNADDCLTLGAALAYYSVFSLAPILVIVIAVAGALFGPEAAQGELVGQIRDLVGDEGASAIQGLIQSASRQGTGSRATLIGLVVLLFGSTSAFSQLQGALNRVWDVPTASHGGVMAMVRARLWSFAAVLGVGFLLTVSLVLTAAITAFGDFWSRWFIGAEALLQLLNTLLGFGLITSLFALIYKIIPRVPIRWSDVWAGAAVTAALFAVGKFLIGLYLGRAGISSAFGAAGALVAVMVWVYYSAQIFLLGAEFTKIKSAHEDEHRAHPHHPRGQPDPARAAAALHPRQAGRPAV